MFEGHHASQAAPERWEREKFAQTLESDAPFSTISGEPVRPLYAEAVLPVDPYQAIGHPDGVRFPRSFARYGDGGIGWH